MKYKDKKKMNSAGKENINSSIAKHLIIYQTLKFISQRC